MNVGVIRPENLNRVGRFELYISLVQYCSFSCLLKASFPTFVSHKIRHFLARFELSGPHHTHYRFRS